MQHRHLLPNEIDLLLDGEVGFGVAPLAAHAEACPECRARLADGRIVVDALENLPHFAPPARFGDKVLAQVQIVEPWHVAVAEAATALVPRSRPLRVMMGVTAGAIASVMSAGAVWLAFRADLALYVFNLATERARSALVGGTGAFIGAAFGQGALDVLRSGGAAALAVGAAVVLASVAGAALGFRALASASHNRK